MLKDVRDFEDPQVRKLIKAERIKADTLDLFGEEPPAELMTDNPLDAEGQGRNATIKKK